MLHAYHVACPKLDSIMAAAEACTTPCRHGRGVSTFVAELTCVPHAADSSEGVGEACLGVATDTRSRHARCGQSAIPFEMGMPGAVTTFQLSSIASNTSSPVSPTVTSSEL